MGLFSFMARYSSYLQLVPNGTYHFRIAIPKDLRLVFNKREIKKSLHTKNVHSAVIQAQELYLQTEQLFEEARMAKKKSPYPDTRIITLKGIKSDSVTVDNITIEADTPEQEKDIAQELIDAETPCPCPWCKGRTFPEIKNDEYGEKFWFLTRHNFWVTNSIVEKAYEHAASIHGLNTFLRKNTTHEKYVKLSQTIRGLQLFKIMKEKPIKSLEQALSVLK